MARYKPPTDQRGGHVRLYWDIVDSNAWRCLSATDQRAYIALQRQLRSTNNGDLSLPLSVARNHGIASPATLAKSLRALVAVGLIAVTRKGGCTRGGQRLATLYRFTDHKCYEVPAKHIEASRSTNEWHDVKTLAQGRDLILHAEAKAAEKEASRKKSPLQSLAVTASNNEVVEALTASNNEVWSPVPLQILKQAKEAKTVSKANNGGCLRNSDDIADSENHTSNIEVLSTYYQVGAVTGAVAVAAPEAKPKPSKKRIVGKAGKSGRPRISLAMSSEQGNPTQPANPMDYASLRAADVGNSIAWATHQLPGCFANIQAVATEPLVAERWPELIEKGCE